MLPAASERALWRRSQLLAMEGGFTTANVGAVVDCVLWAEIEGRGQVWAKGMKINEGATGGSPVPWVFPFIPIPLIDSSCGTGNRECPGRVSEHQVQRETEVEVEVRRRTST